MAAALAPARASACSSRLGPGVGKCPGWRAPGGWSEGYSELTSYSEVLQRAAAADRRHIDGFQSQHRKPRPIAREPLPLPARRARPPRHLPRPSAAAGGCVSAASVGTVLCCPRVSMELRPRASSVRSRRVRAPGPPRARLWEGGISHEENPIDASLQRGGCFPSGRRANRSQNRGELGGGRLTTC